MTEDPVPDIEAAIVHLQSLLHICRNNPKALVLGGEIHQARAHFMRASRIIDEMIGRELAKGKKP
jgi:hypothetical protein